MTEVLVIMTAGMLLGYALRSKLKVIKLVNKSTIWIIFILLFFMGISVGADDKIMNNIGSLGLLGLILSVTAISGSVMLSWIVYNLFFKDQDG